MMKSLSYAPSSLWRWISIRVIGMALLVEAIVGVGMWYRFVFWEASHRKTLPAVVQAELESLEAQLEREPGKDLPRLRQIYGQYLYGEYFAPNVVRQDLLVIGSLVVFSLPLIIVGGVWVSLRMSRQLGAVAVAAERIAEGAFSSRAHIQDDAPSALKTLALDFNRMAERLERYDRELQASSAAIAHELRTPLTAAKARLQAVLDEVMPGSRENMAMIMSQLDQINRLVNDLYLLSLASAGELVLMKERVDVRSLVNERLNWSAPMLMAGGVRTDVDIPDKLYMHVDRDRIGQVLSILIDNVIQYAGTGEWLGVSAGRRDGQVRLVIRDAGKGFPAKYIDRVCDRFWRAEGSRSRNKGGAGLGLSVAAAICSAHGGALEVSNSRAGGAMVTVILPIGEGMG